jgi:nucleotide-binding universal stress UspA family protein
MDGRILVPTDGSDHALAAAAHAGVLARAFDADVDVLHVVDLAQRGSAFDAGGATGEFVERLESEGEAAVEETAAAVPASHRGGTETVSGAVPATIHEYVADNAVGLIVMGTHGRTGVRRYITGSVTEAVVREASVPVLTVQADTEAPEGGYGDVLVPTDGSDHALAAADRATEVAAAFDARIHVLSVVDLGSLAPGVDPAGVDVAVEQFRERARAAAVSVATRVADESEGVTTEVREGRPPSTIRDYAAESDVDLIAMGTHGRSGIERVLLGSTTERVIRHGDRPVLSICEGGE